MVEPAGIESKLAFLPRLLEVSGSDPERLEALLGDLCAACAWARVGLACAGLARAGLPQGVPIRMAVERGGRLLPESEFPSEPAKVGADEIVSDPAEPGRRWVAFRPSAERTGALWADMDRPGGWNKNDALLLRLAARMLAASPRFRAESDRVVEEARSRQRLNDAATVAGRMAHDLDNLWTGILGFGDLALAQLPQGSPAHQYISEIAAIGQRGVEMTQQLHQFSRCGSPRPTPTSVRQVIERAQAAQGPEKPWEVRIPDDLPTVAMDGAALQAIVAHLVDNAQEALARGSVRVEASVKQMSAAEAASLKGMPSPGTYVELAVSDRGPGFRDDVLARVFAEPFVTTKTRHRGLGLAIVYRIIQAYGGGIRIETAPKSGTTMRALLPVASEHPYPERRAP